MIKGAHISKCGNYRYQLWRIWDETLPMVLFIMHNPSTADAEQDDPTIRRCINFAKSWGYGGIFVGNIIAYRATHPSDIPTSAMSSFNDWKNGLHLIEMIAKVDKVICAWGNPSRKFKLNRELINYDSFYHLQLTKSGNPCHPLYLKSNLIPIANPERISPNI